MRLPSSKSARKIVMPFSLDPSLCAATGSGGSLACSARCEAAAVNVSCPPEQIVPLNIDRVVLHEVAPLGQAERRTRLPENALTLPCLPRREPSRRHLVEEIRKARDHRRDLVRLVREKFAFCAPLAIGCSPTHSICPRRSMRATATLP